MNIFYEEWRPVKDYEGYYEVSNFGNVRSVDRVIQKHNGRTEKRKGQLKAQRTDKDGYKITTLIKNNKFKTMKVHRLVATAFWDNKENKPEVNHIDCDKSNNHFTNLEWVTSSQNKIHAIENGLCNFMEGTKCHMSKFDDFDVLNILTLYSTGEYTQKLLAEIYGVSKATICRVVNRQAYNDI